ncbi:MAG: TetR/AcrR family transcriptional regulator [Pseudomonadota bacterium]
MATQAERRAATRAKLISTSREHFARNGFDDTHTNDILDDIGLSRGALYHHFGSKQELFEAVFLAASVESVDYAISKGADGENALESLISSCMAWLRVVRQPEVASILIDQGPRVLGWKRARELEGKTSFKPMRQALERAVAEDWIQVQSVELAARFINAMLTEAAMAGLHSSSRTSIAKIETLLRQFIQGLRVPISS